MDASIMCGAGLGAGAVAVVRGVRHPVALARRGDGGHSAPAPRRGRGAERLAAEHGLELCDDDWFVTERQREPLDGRRRALSARWRSTRAATWPPPPPPAACAASCPAA